MKITTERLVVRSFAAGDWQNLLEILRDKEASPFAQYDYPVPTNEADVRGVVAGYRDSDKLVAIWLKKDQRVIGYVALMGKRTWAAGPRILPALSFSRPGICEGGLRGRDFLCFL